MNLQSRIREASEYGINSLKTLKNAEKEYKNNVYDGGSILKLIINIHETYLKILKGETDEKEEKK